MPSGVGHKAVLTILNESNGGAISVSEEKITLHVSALYQKFGIEISPEGAVTVAALAEAKSLGLVDINQKIVCFNTESAEKYLPNIRELLSSASP